MITVSTLVGMSSREMRPWDYTRVRKAAEALSRSRGMLPVVGRDMAKNNCLNRDDVATCDDIVPIDRETLDTVNMTGGVFLGGIPAEFFSGRPPTASVWCPDVYGGMSPPF
jgi:hypothetical protein